MNAPVASASSIGTGLRSAAGRLGKRPVIGVAIVAPLVAALLGIHALTQPGSASHDATATNPSTFIPAVSTAQYSDDLMSQQDDWIHAMAARADGSQTTSSEQQRFLEENTITLPSVGIGTAGMTGCNDEMICPWIAALSG